jgi:NitT/TauT family transport system substrate-binding protein
MQFFDLFLANIGLSKSDVTLLVVDPAAMMGTYASRQADAVLTLGPFGLPIAETTRPSKAIWADEYGVAFLSYGIIAHEQKIESRKAALRTFVEIQARAWKFIADDHVTEAVAAIIKQRPNANLNPSVLKGQLELYLQFLNTPNTQDRPIGWQSDVDWAATLSSMQKANFLKTAGVPGANFTNEFFAST